MELKRGRKLNVTVSKTGCKQRGKRWPGENCPLWREFWIQTWHVRLVAVTGGCLIKLLRFSGLSTNTNVTFYCNCPIAPFTISTPPSDCLLAYTHLKLHIAPQGTVRPTLKTTILNECFLLPAPGYVAEIWLKQVYL